MGEVLVVFEIKLTCLIRATSRRCDNDVCSTITARHPLPGVGGSPFRTCARWTPEDDEPVSDTKEYRDKSSLVQFVSVLVLRLARLSEWHMMQVHDVGVHRTQKGAAHDNTTMPSCVTSELRHVNQVECKACARQVGATGAGTHGSNDDGGFAEGFGELNKSLFEMAKLDQVLLVGAATPTSPCAPHHRG